MSLEVFNTLIQYCILYTLQMVDIKGKIGSYPGHGGLTEWVNEYENNVQQTNAVVFIAIRSQAISTPMGDFGQKDLQHSLSSYSDGN